MKKRIGIIGDNSIEFVKQVMEIWENNDCVVIVDWRIPLERSLKMLEDANVSVCYIQDNLHQKSVSSEKIEIIPYRVKDLYHKSLPDEIYHKFQPRYDNEEALILFSSGTTGRSKGIVFSNSALNKNADAIIKSINITEDDCIVVLKSFAHSSSFVGDLLVSLKTGSKIVIGKTVVPPRYVFNLIREFNTTILNVNPTLLKIYLDNKLEQNLYRLKAIYVSGSNLSSELMEKARERLKKVSIYNAYGLTEAGPRVAMQQPGHCHGKSVGVPIECAKVKILSENGNMQSKNTPGVIYVKSSSMFSGYVNGEDNGGEWFNTKDIGYFNSYNELEIIGRQDDLIISHSHNVYPNEIEEIILSFDEVQECVVSGVSDDVLGQKIVCLYALKNNKHISEKELHLRCKKMLPNYEIPQMWLETKSIPVNLNGKIDRKKAKEEIFQKIIQ